MLLLAAIVWGFGITIQNISGQNLGSFTVTTFKAAGGILLILLCKLLNKKFTKKVIIVGTICGAVLFLGEVCQQAGIVKSTISKSSFITALYIVFVPFIGILFGYKTKINVWIGIIVAAIGTYFLCVTDKIVFQSGDILLFIGAICFALQIVVVSKYVNDVEPLTLAAVQTTSTFIFSLICTLIFENPELSSIKDVILPLAYVCLFSCVFAQTIQIIYQKYVEPSTAGIIMGFESVFGVISGFLILHQILTLREAIGCIIIFIAVLIAQKQ